LEDKIRGGLIGQVIGDLNGLTQRSEDAREKANAAYLAICLDVAPELKEKYPRRWAAAVSDLSSYRNIFADHLPSGNRIRRNALAAGLRRPEHPIKLWTWALEPRIEIADTIPVADKVAR
jgi:hypothetical protein